MKIYRKALRHEKKISEKNLMRKIPKNLKFKPLNVN